MMKMNEYLDRALKGQKAVSEAEEEEDYSHMPPDNMKNLKLYVKWDNSDPQTFTMLRNLIAKIRANKTISAKEAGVAGEFINKILGINPSKFKMFLGKTEK